MKRNKFVSFAVAALMVAGLAFADNGNHAGGGNNGNGQGNGGAVTPTAATPAPTATAAGGLGIGVGVGIAQANAGAIAGVVNNNDLSNRNTVTNLVATDVRNTNTNLNTNLNNNTNRNTNVNSNRQAQIQGQAQQQGQDQRQSQTNGSSASTANNSQIGGGAIVTTGATNVSFNQAEIPNSYTIKNTPSIGLATVYPTAPCMGSSSVGGSGPGFSLGIGTSWTDKNCQQLETARSFEQSGLKEDAMAIRCQSEYAAVAPSCMKLKADAEKAEAAKQSAIQAEQDRRVAAAKAAEEKAAAEEVAKQAKVESTDTIVTAQAE